MKFQASQIETIKTLIERGAIFYISHSGGKDSQAMYSLIKSIVPHNQIEVIHAPLGEVEWQGVIEHIEDTIEHELQFSKAIWKDGSDKHLLDEIRERGMFPGRNQPFCTSGMKIGPIAKVIRKRVKENNNKLVVDCRGIRSAESTRRQKMNELELSKTNSKAGREWYIWHPIFTWSDAEVFEYIELNGQKPHFAYEIGMPRLSCVFCIHAQPKDIKLAKSYNEDLFTKYVELENEIEHTMFSVQGEDGKAQPINLLDYIALAD